MEKEKEGSSSSRRSWPWKKKSSDKVAASLVSSAGAASPNSSAFFDDPPQQQQQVQSTKPNVSKIVMCCSVALSGWPVYLISCLQIWRSSNSHGILESIHPGLQHESSRPWGWGCLIWTWISNTGLKGVVVVVVDAEMGIESSQWLGTNLSSQGTKSQIHREMQNS